MSVCFVDHLLVGWNYSRYVAYDPFFGASKTILASLGILQLMLVVLVVLLGIYV